MELISEQLPKRNFEEGSPGYEVLPLVSRTHESEISRLINSEFVATKCGSGLNLPN
jgi:hypothetical protein